MTYDSQKQKTVLFGGILSHINEYVNDTWVWDGKFWTQRQDIGRPRAIHAMAYDSERKHVVLFGGVDKTAALNDTWELKVEIHTE